MADDLKELLFRLCAARGTPGDETAAARAAAKELAPYGGAVKDALGNISAAFGPENAEGNILLEAHLDQIGLVVTSVDGNGFLRVDKCGGADPRVLPGSAVTVKGKKALSGIVCCTPPHLSDGKDDEVLPVGKSFVDIGLSKEKAEELVSPGDRVTFSTKPVSLAGSRVSSAGLDNRAGAAALVRCAQMLYKTGLKRRVTVLLSTREETGGQGASTGAFSAEPSEAICVDVGFACQPGVPPEKSHPLGGGPMVGFAPVLNRRISENLVKTAVKNNIPYKRDVMGGSTGTNSDNIAVVRSGVPTGMVSIPLRYMHTPAEVIDLRDIENTALLIAEYIKGDF
jgi:endoglucanase